MPIDPLAAASAGVIDALRAAYGPALGQASVGERINERLTQWQVAAGLELHASFPFELHENRLKDWRHRLRHEAPDPAHLPDVVADYMSACKATGHPANEAFWTDRLKAGGTGRKARKSATANLSVTLESMLSNWQKNIDHARSAWEIEKIGTLRAALLKELEEILKLLQQLQQQLDTLGLDPGILFDLSIGTLSAQDIEHFQRWATYLADDPGVRALCELLGKIRQLELSERIERVTVSRTQTTIIPHIDSREEIVGVRLGRDLEHLVPSELALLADPDTALLFDLKYVEARLMCFDMQGLQAWHTEVDIEEERTTREADKQGPMILCIDTSGSMQGMPETIAKAVALFMASKAREKKRSCYLINFSTGLATLDLAGEWGMDTLMGFLGMSFHGGTDVAPALDKALQVMQEDAYRNADALIISDFIMAGLPKDTLERIGRQRSDGNRFHSLVIGDCYMTERLKSLFDQEWVFDPRRSQIRELTGFERKLNQAPSGEM
jgi:uncharacterized protein with von Willebrand factor type A (vWA) domain